MPLYIATAFFLATTIMGLYLSACVFLKRTKPASVIIIHGILSITGFLILILRYPETLFYVLLLLIATGFGLCLLYQEINNKPFTKWFCIAHGILSITGCVFLVRYAVDFYYTFSL
jgi:hypothetical protein